MKKQLLTAFLCMLTFSFTKLQAQTFTNGATSFVQDLSLDGTSCLRNGTSAGYLAQGANVQSSSYSGNDFAILINHKSTIDLGATPGWWSLVYTNGENCDFMNVEGGVDLSASDNQFVCITAKASVAGTYQLFLGKTGAGEWFPNKNTYADNILVELELTTELVKYSINLNGTGFENLTYNDSINTWTIIPTDENQAGSTISVSRIGLGESACAAPNINVQVSGTDYEHYSIYNFSPTQLGSSTDAVFTIQNTGDATLLINSLTIDGDGYSLISAKPSSVAAGSSTDVTVRFTPTLLGENTGSFYVTTNDEDFGGGLFISIKGTAIAPEINVKQSSTNYGSGSNYNFGNIKTGNTAEVNFTIENTGTAALTFTGIDVTGTGYSMVNALPTSLEGGSTTTLTIKFSPTTATTHLGTLTLTTNDDDEGSYVINLLGAGEAVTGVLNNSNISETYAYINSNGMINVRGIADGNYEYKILNTQGLELLSGQTEVNMGELIINPGSLSTGVYLVSFINEKGLKSTFRVIVN